MLNIHLHKPYKIVTHKVKRYSSHYQIPAEACVIIPTKYYGEEALCSVRWEDSNGVLHLKEGLIFALVNLEPVNAMSHFALHELWQHYNKLGLPPQAEVAIDTVSEAQ
jgi:hypothetical protein